MLIPLITKYWMKIIIILNTNFLTLETLKRIYFFVYCMINY